MTNFFNQFGMAKEPPKLAPPKDTKERTLPAALQTIDDAVRAGANTLTFGMADRLAGAMPAWLGGEENPQLNTEIARKESPIATTVGDVAGTLAPAAGATKLVTMGIPALAKATIPRMVAREGIAGTGLSTAQQALSGEPVDLGEAGTAGGISAAIPGVLGAKLSPLKYGSKILNKVLSTVGNKEPTMLSAAGKKVSLPELPKPKPIPAGEAEKIANLPKSPLSAPVKPVATAEQKAAAKRIARTKAITKNKRLEVEVAKRSKAPGVSPPKVEAPPKQSKEELKAIYQKQLDAELERGSAELRKAAGIDKPPITKEGIKKAVADKFKDLPREEPVVKRSRAPASSPVEGEVIGTPTKSATTGKQRGGEPRKVRTAAEKKEIVKKIKSKLDVYGMILAGMNKATPLSTSLGTTLSQMAYNKEKRRGR